MFNNKNEIVIKGKPLTKNRVLRACIYKLTEGEMKEAGLSSSSFFFLFFFFFFFFSGFSLFKVVQPQYNSSTVSCLFVCCFFPTLQDLTPTNTAAAATTTVLLLLLPLLLL